MKQPVDFWDALAPYHAGLEDNYLNRASIRHLVHELSEPVLVVGAGQGLIVAEIKRRGLHCDGLDLSAEMIRFARARRGLRFIQADASAIPFSDGSYATLFYATGVIDFISDEEAIRSIERRETGSEKAGRYVRGLL